MSAPPPGQPAPGHAAPGGARASDVVRAPGSGAMFDLVAPRYDLLNALMSIGLDRLWRRALVRAMAPALAGSGEVLDAATGTADVALALARAAPTVRVTGLDPSARMLDRGRAKVAARRLDDRIALIAGDAQALPFAAGHFAGAAMAFGIRNVPDRLRALAEMARVCVPGAPVAILELTEPAGRGPAAALARLYVHHVVPFLGALVSGAAEYRYLQASIAAFPPPPAFAALMAAAGLREVTYVPLSFGAVHLFVGRVPDA